MTIPTRTRLFRHRVVVGLCGVVTLAVALAGADLLVAHQVRTRVVSALRCVTGDDTLTPGVSTGSTPVLVDLVSGGIGTVTVTGLTPASLRSSDLLRESSTTSSHASSHASSSVTDLLGTGDLTLRLRGVGPGHPPSISSAQASATLEWKALAARAVTEVPQLAGATFGRQGDLLRVTVRQRVAGRPLQVLMGLRAAGSSLVLTPRTVVIGGRQLPVALVAGLAGGLLGASGKELRDPRTVDLGLPRGISLADVTTAADGLDVRLDLDPSLLVGGSCVT